MPVKAVVLLSGGMDSATCLALARAEGREIFTLTFSYRQRHRVEVEAAEALSSYFGVPGENRRVVDLGPAFGGSALTDPELEVPLDRPQKEMARVIPPTYVPARNLVFLSLAGSWAEQLGAREIWMGANARDFSGYPDCRPEFLSAFEEALRLGTRAGVEGEPIRLRTPLLHLSKAEIVRLGRDLGVPFELTHTCYLGLRPPCGRCDACRLRARGFREAGVEDPLFSSFRGDNGSQATAGFSPGHDQGGDAAGGSFCASLWSSGHSEQSGGHFSLSRNSQGSG